MIINPTLPFEFYVNPDGDLFVKRRHDVGDVGALGLLTCAHCIANLRAIGRRPYTYHPHPRPFTRTLPLPTWYRAIALALNGKPNNLFWKGKPYSKEDSRKRHEKNEKG